VIVCVPASLLSLAGGYIWENTVYGFLAAYPGVLAGASISFFMGRVLFKDFLETELRGNLKFAALSQAAEDSGYKVVFFARLSPIPTGLLNYAFAISAIQFKQFLVSTALGLVPIAVLYAKAGSDFFTYFETNELQESVQFCVGNVDTCCTELDGGYADNTFTDTCAMPALSEILSVYESKEGAMPACMDGADVTTKEIFMTCLEAQGKDCSFATIEEEASDLQCKYNVDDCAGADNNDCLRALNGSETWPKVVLPVALVITIGIVGFFGKRGLARAGLLQVSYNLDRQRELLMAEREMLNQGM